MYDRVWSSCSPLPKNSVLLERGPGSGSQVGPGGARQRTGGQMTLRTQVGPGGTYHHPHFDQSWAVLFCNIPHRHLPEVTASHTILVALVSALILGPIIEDREGLEHLKGGDPLCRRFPRTVYGTDPCETIQYSRNKGPRVHFPKHPKRVRGSPRAREVPVVRLVRKASGLGWRLTWSRHRAWW